MARQNLRDQGRGGLTPCLTPAPRRAFAGVGVVAASVLLGTACSAPHPTSQPQLESPAGVQTPPNVVPTDPIEPSVPAPVGGWTPLEPGLEEQLWADPGGFGQDLVALRVDPALFDIGVGYSPGAPKTLSQWLETSGAVAVVNGGYFDAADRATALVVVDGVPHGVSYEGFGGMLAVNGGGPSLTWLATHPFSGTEGLSAAIQSAPMLVVDGQRVYDGFDIERNRRAAVALDGAGRVLLFVTPGAGYTLGKWADRLLDAEFDVRQALNLDGGKSAGIAIQPPGSGIPALVPVPAVVTVHRRADP